MARSVVERAPAKINLDLRILAREPDGYHRLETTFQALELHDVLEATAADDFALDIDGDIDVGPEGDNLVLRAAHAFVDAVSGAPRARFRLEKRIPAGAGLGGGSSDGAAALRAMNTLAGCALPDDELRALGASLGSDVAFFLCGSSLADATGRGDILTPLAPLERADVVLVDPGFQISTPEAFGWWDEAAEACASQSSDPTGSPRNDFESVVFVRHPRLQEIRDLLLGAGAARALLSGSGSCVYGLFGDLPSARAAGRAVREADPGAHVLLTRTAR